MSFSDAAYLASPEPRPSKEEFWRAYAEAMIQESFSAGELMLTFLGPGTLITIEHNDIVEKLTFQFSKYVFTAYTAQGFSVDHVFLKTPGGMDAFDMMFECTRENIHDVEQHMLSDPANYAG